MFGEISASSLHDQTQQLKAAVSVFGISDPCARYLRDLSANCDGVAIEP